MSRHFDDLDAVLEFDALDDFRQLIFALRSSPCFCGGVDEFEHHKLGSLRRQGSFRPHGSMTHRIRAVTALPQASRCECGIGIWNIVNKPPFKKGFSLKSSFLAARNLTFRCKLLKFGPQTVFWRLKNDSFEFFWIYAKSAANSQSFGLGCRFEGPRTSPWFLLMRKSDDSRIR